MTTLKFYPADCPCDYEVLAVPRPCPSPAFEYCVVLIIELLDWFIYPETCPLAFLQNNIWIVTNEHIWIIGDSKYCRKHYYYYRYLPLRLLEIVVLRLRLICCRRLAVSWSKIVKSEKCLWLFNPMKKWTYLYSRIASCLCPYSFWFDFG